jgi:4-amino-4-deoxy-L-arabinose transferase-like glycosyltransferase
LVDETEPLFAEAARQMTVTGDWITPYFNGETRFDKPPLIYWLIAWGYEWFGVNAWTTRIPSALAATLSVVLSALTLWRFSPRRSPSALVPFDPTPWIVGNLGAAAIAFTPEMTAWARVGVSDMLLTGCMTTALLAFFWSYAAAPSRRWRNGGYLAFYGAIALAILTKGPVGIALPGLIVGAFALYTGEFWRLFWETRPVRGFSLVLLLNVPWYAAVIQANGQAYIDSFFGYHNLERFTRVVNQHAAPWYFYILVVAVGAIPWSPYLPIALGRLHLLQPGWWRSRPRAQRLGLFAALWFGVIFGFFTVAVTKLPSYVLPLMPAVGILVALLWGEWWSGQTAAPAVPRPGLATAPIAPPASQPWPRSLTFSTLGAIAVLGILAIGFAAQGWWLPLIYDPAMPNLTEVLMAAGVATWAAGIWGITTAIALGLMLTRRGHWVWLATAIGFAVFWLITILPAGAIIDEQRQEPLRVLAADIVTHRQPGEEVLAIGGKKPSLTFYSEQTITYTQRATPAIARLRRELAIAPPEPSTLLILSDARKLTETGIVTLPQEAIAQAGIYRLIRIDQHILAAHNPVSDRDD